MYIYSVCCAVMLPGGSQMATIASTSDLSLAFSDLGFRAVLADGNPVFVEISRGLFACKVHVLSIPANSSATVDCDFGLFDREGKFQS